jgi:hypothetical protein
MLINIAQQPTNTLSTALMQFHTGYSQFEYDSASSNTSLQARDHPDHDFYQDSSWTHSLIYFMVLFAICSTTIILTFGGLGDIKLLRFLVPNGPILVSYIPFYLPLSIWLLVLLFMVFEDITCAQGNVLRSFMGMKRKSVVRACKLLVFVSGLGGTILCMAFPDPIIVMYFPCLGVVIYCMLSMIVIFTNFRHGNVF